MTLLRAIEVYLERTGTPPTRFGREALGDPRLIRDLHRGRELRPETMARLQSFLRQAGISA